MCEHGHIYPHDVDTLAASTNGRGPIAKALVALDCTTIVQDGSDGVNATFHVRDFEAVAEVMKPRRRRRLSPEYKAKLAAASEPYRFTCGTHSPQTALESPRSPQDVNTRSPIQSPNLAPYGV